MKFISKINRGAIVTAAVLIGVVVYLVVLSWTQAAEKVEIEKVCAEYIKTEVGYSMLPTKYRIEKPDMPAAESKQYLAEMAESLQAFYLENDQVIKFNLERVQNELQKQMSGIGVIYDYQKTIAKFSSFVFDGKNVTVAMRVNTVLDGPSNDGMATSRQKSVEETEDTMILQKVDGLWKVAYANLNKPGGYNNWANEPVGQTKY